MQKEINVREDPNTGEKFQVVSESGFCIVMYQCQHCGAVEQVFNNSNCDVPLFISCEACPGVMTNLPTQHIKMPDFDPPHGLRMFVEINPLEARKRLSVQLTECWSEIKDNYKNVKEAVDDFMERFYKPGEVAIVQVDKSEEKENDKDNSL